VEELRGGAHRGWASGRRGTYTLYVHVILHTYTQPGGGQYSGPRGGMREREKAHTDRDRVSEREDTTEKGKRALCV
jgi:hypothetical protein